MDSQNRFRVRDCCIWLTPVLLAIAGVSCAPIANDPPAVQQVAFRFDDFSAKSDTAFEAKLFDVFRRHGICVTVGVIPDVVKTDCHQPGDAPLEPLTDAKASMLRDGQASGTVEPALHGFSHQTQRSGPTCSEFVGLTYDAQRARIAQGKQMLEQATGSTIQIFIPPWDSYDDVTLQVLADLGFTYISADTGSPVRTDLPLKYVPCTCELRSIADLTKPLEKRRLGSQMTPIVVLFHSYDFTDAGSAQASLSLADLDGLLTWLQLRSDVQILPLAQTHQADTPIATGLLGILWNMAVGG